MSEPDWSDLPERLARLGEWLGAVPMLRPWPHDWRLEPPLTAEEMASLEARIGVRLPYEYRHFLLHAGRGGPGPGRGLFPVRRTDGEWRWHTEEPGLIDLDALARPFPHVEAYDPYGAAGLTDDLDDEEYDRRRDAVQWAPDATDGLLYLEDTRVGVRSALVVTGPSRGEIWTDDDTHEGRILRPNRDYPRMDRIGFARWYYRWLEFHEDRREAGRP